jgi:hypothetical protein
MTSSFTHQDSKRRGARYEEASLAENPQSGHSYFSSASWFACKEHLFTLSLWNKNINEFL